MNTEAKQKKVIRGILVGLSMLFAHNGFAGPEPTVTEIKASSSIPDEGDKYHYGPDQAFDGNPITAWNEGADGDGIGEYVELVFDSEISIGSIEIMGGYFDRRYFKKNNRVKKLKVILDGPAGSDMTLSIEDDMTPQKFMMGGPVSFSRIRFEIAEVYKGSSWDDTCIAEIALYDRGNKIWPIVSQNVKVTANVPRLLAEPRLSWKRKVGNSDVMRITPHRTVANDILFVDLFYMGTAALEVGSGEQKWREASAFGPGGIHTVGERYMTLTGGMCAATCTYGFSIIDFRTGKRLLDIGDRGDTKYWDVALSDEFVAFYFGDDELRALRLAPSMSEAKSWKLHAKADTSLKIVDGTLYFGRRSEVHAMDIKNASKKWSASVGTKDFSLVDVAENIVLIKITQNNSSRLLALDRKTGRENWQIYAEGKISNFSFSDGSLYFTGDRSVYISDVTTGDYHKTPTNYPIQGMGALGPILFLVSGRRLIAFDAESEQNLWEYKAANEINPKLGVTSDTLYFATKKNELHALTIQ